MIDHGARHLMLDIPYRGSRTYLTGADLASWVGGAAEQLSGRPGAFLRDIAFRSPISCVPYVRMGRPADRSILRGDFTLADPATAWEGVGYLAESGQVVSQRVEYDEERIVSSAVLEPSGASLESPADVSPIQAVVALMKAECNVLSPLPGGRWIFAGMRFVRPLPEAAQSVAVRLKKLYPGQSASAEVLLDDQPSGIIRFMVWHRS